MCLQEADFFSLFNMGQGALLLKCTWKKMWFAVPMYTYTVYINTSQKSNNNNNNKERKKKT